MRKILVICGDNSSRSQMAEGYLKELLSSEFKVYSAGMSTSSRNISKDVIEIMREVNIDISNRTINNFKEYRDIDFNFIISLCEDDTESCPYFPSNAQIYHEDILTPSSMGSTIETTDNLRATRKLIKEMCERFVNKNIPVELRSRAKVY